MADYPNLLPYAVPGEPMPPAIPIGNYPAYQPIEQGPASAPFPAGYMETIRDFHNNNQNPNPTQAGAPEWMNPNPMRWDANSQTWKPKSQVDPMGFANDAAMRRSYYAGMAGRPRIGTGTSGPNQPAYGQPAYGSGASYGPLSTTPSYVRTVKNPGIDNELTANINWDQSPLGSAKGQSLEDFVKEFHAGRAQEGKNLDQESGFINDTYSPGGVEGQLGLIRAQRGAALRQAAGNAIARAQRANSLARMQGGNSSYLDRAYGDSMGNILTGQAVTDSDQARQDAMYVQQQREGLLGKRNAMTDSYVQGGLLLPEASDRARQSDLSDAYLQTLTDQANAGYQYQPVGTSLTPPPAYGYGLQPGYPGGYPNGYSMGNPSAGQAGTGLYQPRLYRPRPRFPGLSLGGSGGKGLSGLRSGII